MDLNRDNLERKVKDGVNTAKDFFSYLLIPLALPFIFIEELIAFIRDKAGLNRRKLEEKVVLITGASSGIGESLAKRFYLAGCHLILVARRKEELERVKNDLVRMKTEGRVHVPAILTLDIGDLNSIHKKSQEALAIHKKIDILINNAGISVRGTVLETELEVQQQIMTVNYFGALALTKEFLPHMIAQKSGNVVFISSIQGRISIPERSGYAASKHAIQALADSLRAEVSKDGILVTVISPGYVKTNLSMNSLTASGSLYGQMDPTTQSGYHPDFVAERTLKAILNNEKEVILAPLIPKLAVFIRVLIPSIYFYIMAKRAPKPKK